MKLVTLQRKEVLDIINSTGEYIPDSTYNLMPDEYPEMFEEYAKSTGIKINAAVWAWHTADYKRADCLPDMELINSMESFYHDENKTIAILLDVPDDLVFLTDAYAWASYVSDPLEIRIENPYLWDAKVNWSAVEYVQAIFPTIKKEYILEYIELDRVDNR